MIVAAHRVEHLHLLRAQGLARGVLKTLSAAEQDELLALLGKISDRIKSEKKPA